MYRIREFRHVPLITMLIGTKAKLNHDAVTHYDTYFAVAQALESAVNAYNKLPYTFRANMDKTLLYIN